MSLIKKFVKEIFPPFIYNFFKIINSKFFKHNRDSLSGPYDSYSEVEYEDVWTSKEWLNYSEKKLSIALNELPKHLNYLQLLVPILNEISLSKKCHVLDWAGGTGYIFFSIRHFLLNKHNIVWHVIDNIFMSDLSKRITSHSNLNIEFYEDLPKKQDIDVLYINTALQYVEKLPELFDNLLCYSPQYIVLTRFLVAKEKAVVMKQKIFGQSTPCIFHSLYNTKSYFSKNSYKEILDLPNFEENNAMHEIIPKAARYKFDTIVSRDLIFKKCDAKKKSK